MSTSRAGVVIALSVGLMCARFSVAASAEDSRAAKINELIQLQGLARMVEQSKTAERAAATQTVRSMTDKMFAQFPNVAAEKRAAMDAAAQRFLSEVQNSFDQDDAVRAWGRFYSEGLTDEELDAIIAYYRSPVGQKDVHASQLALPQFQKYLAEKRATVMNTAIANYTAALRQIVAPAQGGDAPPPGESTHSASPARTEAVPAPALGSNPSVPEGKVIPGSVSDHCEEPLFAAPGSHHAPPSGRSVLCVCVDEKGALTQSPVVTESSGDPRVDSGAVKLARAGSGRYQPPTLDGAPQKGCFRFSINFRQSE
jgi:hypothetical protein